RFSWWHMHWSWRFSSTNWILLGGQCRLVGVDGENRAAKKNAPPPGGRPQVGHSLGQTQQFTNHQRDSLFYKYAHNNIYSTIRQGSVSPVFPLARGSPDRSRDGGAQQLK